MSTYFESYCNTTSDLTFIEPYIGEYDGKKVLASNWVASGTSHLYYLYNTGDASGQVYKDGKELTSTTNEPSSDDNYRYTASTDLLEYYFQGTSVNNLNSSVFEASRDWSDLKTEAVKRASDFVRSFLPFPIYPNKGVGTMDASSFNYPEIIVRCTSIIAVDSLVRPYDVEKADQIRSQAINDQGTGGIADVRGRSSYPWDIIKIIISSGGTFTAGTENTTVKFNSFIGNENGLKLEQMANDEIIDGYWQLVGHDMYVRFTPGLYTTGDEFELEVSGELDQSFTPIKSVRATRY
jgi:hypothetical protein